MRRCASCCAALSCNRISCCMREAVGTLCTFLCFLAQLPGSGPCATGRRQTHICFGGSPVHAGLQPTPCPFSRGYSRRPCPYRRDTFRTRHISSAKQGGTPVKTGSGPEDKGRPAPTAQKMGDFENTPGKDKGTSMKKEVKPQTADGSEKSAKSPISGK